MDAARSAPQHGDREPVAIVGMGCRLPGGVESPEQYWNLLLDERDTVSQMPGGRWSDYESSANSAVSSNTVRHGSFLDDVTGFDAEFFGIVPREAELMDPQQRMLLEVTWNALEHAGIPPTEIAGTDTGVYVGAVSDDYERRLLEDLPGIEAWSGIGTQPGGMANRISHALDLRGASLTVDTACSASLVALHLACRSLTAGEIPLAIVGGANLVVAPGLTVMLDAAGALSADGRSKPFDAKADGYGRGEGAAVVVLKRLRKALEDEDHVHAVIRGSAVHQDGRTNGIMAPSEHAQEHLLRSAYRAARLRPDSIGYLEAHGTGTAVGDPIEANAAAAVLCNRRSEEHPLLIGSVKGNIGHLEGGAGVASVIKTALSLQHGTVPASLHCTTPNPEIAWDTNNMRVPTAASKWPREDLPRRAGVSGNGYGGTLAHIVLEQAPPAAVQRAGDELAGHLDEPRVFSVSGSTEWGMRANAGKLADWLAGHEHASIDAVGHTLSSRRCHLRHRGAVVAQDRSTLIEGLRALSSGQGFPSTTEGSVPAGSPRDAVFVFSGHGSQWPAMGRELLATNASFARALDEIAPVFRAELGSTPRELLELGTLDDVGEIQPLIYAIQVALTAVWRDCGVEPAAVVGHSVGEIAAAVAAGVMNARDGARLVCRRSVLLRGVAGNGAMFMTDLSFEEARRRVEEIPDVSAAISASPCWTVVSGERSAIDDLAQELRGEGGVVRRIDSNVAFHSPQLTPLVDDMAEAAQELVNSSPKVRLYRTAIEAPRAEPHDYRHYWATQLRAPVRFSQAVSAAAEDGYRVFLEVSPHPVVTHSIREVLFELDVRDWFVTGTLRRGTGDRAALLTNLAASHCYGIPVDLGAFFRSGELIELPGTVWRHRPHWRKPTRGASSDAPGHDVSTNTLLGGSRTVVADTPLCSWWTRLDYSSRPYRGNHPVRGVEIVPAAVLLHTLHEAARTTGKPTLADVSFRAPITLTSPSEVQVTQQDEALLIATRRGTGELGHEVWLRNTTARCRTQPPAPTARLGLDALRNRCGEKLPPDHLSTLLASLGVPAMGFPWQVEELGRADNEELYAVVSSGEQVGARTWASLLDAALSLPTALFPGPPKLRMPAELGKSTIRGEPLERAVVHVRLHAPDETDTVTVLIADVEGRLVAKFTDLRFGDPGEDAADTSAAAVETDTSHWDDLGGEALLHRLREDVRAHVAAEARCSVDEIDIDRPLVDIGMDSVMTVAVRDRLRGTFPVPIPPTLVWDRPTVRALAEYLHQKLATGKTDEPVGGAS
ncbi:Acyl transferase domain-containing protein [Actinopolyspora mzabensis]|uniref:Acyl transferase domain-containing protein n=1 Tax=Actinopolyspora mzabensis TaxID=995066 RepID=A0A1G8Y479_ACTMZ|nr:type I polyketide synthase [Actinopolyspora mzabensis]SDJ97581.1 Acyl transferase domain-containing protein [Actinopolyspora mzabensis]